MSNLKAGLERLANLSGPVIFAASGFLAAFAVQRTCTSSEFGIFAFVQVLLASGMALTNGLVSVPSMSEIARGNSRTSVVAAFLPPGLIYCTAGCAIIYPIVLSSGASQSVALLSTLLAFLSWARYLYRALSLAILARADARTSDIAYGILYSIGIAVLFTSRHVNLVTMLSMQVAASVCALVLAARSVGLMPRIGRAGMDIYRSSFKTVGLGAAIVAVAGQVSSSAHAYITTLWLSPSAFAPLALAMLVYRPLGVALTGMMQFETPRLANEISKGDAQSSADHVRKILRELYALLGLFWVGNAVIAIAIGVFADMVIGSRAYNLFDVRLSLALVGILVLLRAAREPQTALLGITGANITLAKLSTACAAITLTAVTAFAYFFSRHPALTLLGPVTGELLNFIAVTQLAKRRRRLGAAPVEQRI